MIPRLLRGIVSCGWGDQGGERERVLSAFLAVKYVHLADSYRLLGSLIGIAFV